MQLFTNNAKSRLVAGISNVSLTMQVAAGEGALFPNPTGGDFFLVTLSKVVSGIETNVEIVKVTSRTLDAFTIVRAQEGTTAQVFAESDFVQLRVTAATQNANEGHRDNVSNPHSVTKTQVGLGNVDNTSDVNKPISTATQSALDVKASTSALTTHTSDIANPHAVTKAQVGLSNVDNTSDVNKPVSTAQQTALDLKFNNAGGAITGNLTVNNSTDSRSLYQVSGVTQAQLQATASAVRLASNNAIPMVLATNGVDRLNIDSNGVMTFGGASATASYAFKGTNTGDLVVFESTDASATAAPDLVLYRNSATPAAADQLGVIVWRGNDSGAAEQQYARMGATLADPTAASEDGELWFEVTVAGAAVERLRLDATGTSGLDTQLKRMMMIDCGLTFLDKGNSGTSTQTLDYTAGSHQKVTATGNHTYAFSNWPPTGNTGFMYFEATNYGAFTITHPTVNWALPAGGYTTSFSTYMTAVAAAGGAATLQSSGTNFLMYWTRDAGTTIYGKLVA